MKRLKFTFYQEKLSIQLEIRKSRQILRNVNRDFAIAKVYHNDVSRKEKKKIELLTWKLTQLRKLEKEGNFIEES
jgi:hypothetical protein